MKRSLLIDVLKTLLSQLIVLHHLCLYSPMAEVLAGAWPALVEWLVQYGPLAVQPFLVIAGFLSAHMLLRQPRCPWPALVWARYLRLAPPLVAALLLVMGATWLMEDALADADWVSPPPGWGQLLAHVLLLQDVLGIASISAGAWYVAIDLQLFALLALLAWYCGRADRPLADTVAPALLALATGASALLFNHLQSLDVWAIYFLSAYGLGALAAWAGPSPAARRWWLLALALVSLDFLLAPRERPLCILATALALWQATRTRVPLALPGGLVRGVQRLADLSYSVFVCHFAAIVLASGLWLGWPSQGLGAALGGIALAWALSLALAAAVQWLCGLALRPSRQNPLRA